MILKNKALAIFDFAAPTPSRLYDRAVRFHLKSATDLIDGKSPTAPALPIGLLGYFPEIAAIVGSSALSHPILGPAIKAEPFACLQLLLRDYEALSPILESVVLNSGEALYYLMKASREQKFPLKNSPETYQKALLKDPFWALRTWGDSQDEKLLAASLHLAQKEKEKSAGAAYVHLYFTPEADPADFVEILSTTPMYAYLASRHFYERNIEFKYFGLRGLTPRWAYHFITDGFLDDEEGLIDTMLSSPDWLVEYLVESERYKDLAYTGGIVEKALKKSENNPMSTHLKVWWERTQDYVKKLPPPKPIKIPGAAKAEEKK